MATALPREHAWGWRHFYYASLLAMGVFAIASGYRANYVVWIFLTATLAGVMFFSIRGLLWMRLNRPERPMHCARAVAPYVIDRMALFLSSILFFVWLAPLKALIPKAGGFFADPYLASLDRLLLGRDAWKIAHLVPFTRAIEVGYTIWPLTILTGVLWIAVTANPAVLRRFFLSWALSFWILGIGLATMMASAGPIFGPDLGLGFEALHDALEPASYVMGLHDRLWHAYASGALFIGGGISAAPSMHCALTFLFAFAVKGTRVFLLACLYSAFIWFGSIYLGWHYAVDGLISLVAVALIWSKSRSVTT